MKGRLDHLSDIIQHRYNGIHATGLIPEEGLNEYVRVKMHNLHLFTELFHMML